MATSVELSSKRQSVVECLRDCIEQIEKGEIDEPVEVVIIVQKKTGGLELLENGISIGNLCFMLEYTKHCWLTRMDVNG